MSKHIIKCLKTAIVAAAASLMLSLTAFAAQGKINFSDPSVTVGDEVNVSMKISSDDGSALGNANVVLTYPTEKLEFVSGTDADGGAGAVRVHGASNGSGTALLEYNLKFKTLSAGSADIKIDSYEVYDTSDQAVEITHQGSSSVTIAAGSDASGNSALGTLDVYPGELSPAFSADTDTYSVTVGSGVDKLTINAIPADSSASVSIQNNESLPMGDSAVTIQVNAADGSSQKTYTINVSKVEGGPENTISETDAQTTEGVQLSSKGKTITIMSPAADVQIPEGFKQGTIKIDDQKVQGWVWGADENPEYCVVYGMNDKGEVNFYRYDMVEKTIQRYFEDPIAAGSVSGAEYNAAVSEKEAAVNSSNFRFVIICVLAALCFVLIMAVIYLSTKIRTMGRTRGGSLRASQERVKRRRNTIEETVEKKQAENLEDDRELLRHDFDGDNAENESHEPMDETQVIRRPERKRRARRIPVNGPGSIEDADEADTSDTAEQDESHDSDNIEDLDI